MGTTSVWGRGLFPFWVGAILAALGVLMLVRSLTARGGEKLSIDLKPLVAITAQYGGSTTSILVNIPGESSSVVTCSDGHQMAKKGLDGEPVTAVILTTCPNLRQRARSTWLLAAGLSSGSQGAPDAAHDIVGNKDVFSRWIPNAAPAILPRCVRQKAKARGLLRCTISPRARKWPS